MKDHFSVNSYNFFLATIIEGLRRHLNLGYYLSSLCSDVHLMPCRNRNWCPSGSFCICLACFSVGRQIVTMMDLKPEGALVKCFVIGSGAIGTLSGFLAMTPFNNVITYSVIILAPILFSRKWLFSFFIDVFSSNKASNHQPSKDFVQLLMASFFVFYVYVCLLPEVGWDALSVHLFIPEYIKFFGSWSFDPNLYVFSLMPNMFVWNISIVNMLGGEAAARFLNFGCLLAAAALGRELVLWAGGSIKEADVGTLILFSSPFCFLEISNIFTDLAWSMYVLAA